MGSLFKRTRKKGVESARDKKRSIKYQLPDGRWRTETAYGDKEASRALLADRERDIARGEVGLTDEFAKHKNTALTEHLSDFLASVRAGGAKAKHIRQLRSRITYALEVMKVSLPGQMKAEAAEKFVLHLQDEGMAPRSVNHYIDALREFSRWGFERERWPSDRLARVKKIGGKQDIRRKRRA